MTGTETTQTDLFGNLDAGIGEMHRTHLGAAPDDRKSCDGNLGEGKAGAAPSPSDARPMTARERKILVGPYGFAKYFLNLPLYDGAQACPPEPRRCVLDNGTVAYVVDEKTDWQKRTLDALDPAGARVSLRTANGSGKTSTILVAAILWHMAVFPNSLVISTAGVDRQVRAQLWPNLRKHAAKLKGWVFHDSSLTIEAPNGSRYMGFTTDKPERAEGWHGKDAEADAAARIRSLAEAHTGPLFIIVDEAKGVPQGIFEAIDRCTFQRLLYCSSPGASDGEFYRSQTSAGYAMTRFVVTAAMCPHADHKKNAETIRKRGLDHPLVRSAIFAEFMTNDQGYVLTQANLDRIMTAPPPFNNGRDKSAFCDFAAGGDENVFADRKGNKAKIVKAWRDTNTMSTVAEFIRLFLANGYTTATAYQIGGDADGLGKPIVDRMAELGWHITPCRNGEVADATVDYYNWGTETWIEGAEQIKRGEVIIEGLEHDEELKAQLTGRKQSVIEGGSKAGGMRVESKKEMRERGVSSPDRADALLACLRKPKSTAPVQAMGSGNAATAEDLYSDDDGSDDGRDYGFLEGARC